MKEYNIEWPGTSARAMKPGQAATTNTAVLSERHTAGPRTNPIDWQSLFRNAILVVVILLGLSTALAFAQLAMVHEPRLRNLDVSRGNLSDFCNLPPIRDSEGAAFDDFVDETVFSWLDGTLATIVTKATDIFSSFNENYSFNQVACASSLLQGGSKMSSANRLPLSESRTTH
jgi:hypothetical protein